MPLMVELEFSYSIFFFFFFLCVPKWPNDSTLPAMSWKDTANNAKNDARTWCHRLILRFESSTTTTHPPTSLCMCALNSCVVILALWRERKTTVFSSLFLFFLPNIYVCFWGSLFFFALFYFLVMFSPNRAETLIFDEIVRRPHYKKHGRLECLDLKRNESRPKPKIKASIGGWHWIIVAPSKDFFDRPISNTTKRGAIYPAPIDQFPPIIFTFLFAFLFSIFFFYFYDVINWSPTILYKPRIVIESFLGEYFYDLLKHSQHSLAR